MNQVVCTHGEKISALVGQLPCRCFWLRFWWLLWLWAWSWSWSWSWLLLLLLLLLLSSVAVAGARMWWAKGVLTAHLMVTWHDWTMARSWMIIRVLSIKKDISREKNILHIYAVMIYIYIILVHILSTAATPHPNGMPRSCDCIRGGFAWLARIVGMAVHLGGCF